MRPALKIAALFGLAHFAVTGMSFLYVSLFTGDVGSLVMALPVVVLGMPGVLAVGYVTNAIGKGSTAATAAGLSILALNSLLWAVVVYGIARWTVRRGSGVR